MANSCSQLFFLICVGAIARKENCLLIVTPPPSVLDKRPSSEDTENDQRSKKRFYTSISGQSASLRSKEPSRQHNAFRTESVQHDPFNSNIDLNRILPLSKINPLMPLAPLIREKSKSNHGNTKMHYSGVFLLLNCGVCFPCKKEINLQASRATKISEPTRRVQCQLCPTVASFGLPNSAPRHCQAHRLDGETNRRTSRCREPACERLAVYGDPSGGPARTCGLHRPSGHVNRAAPICRHPEGCHRRAAFGPAPPSPFLPAPFSAAGARARAWAAPAAHMCSRHRWSHHMDARHPYCRFMRIRVVRAAGAVGGAGPAPLNHQAAIHAGDVQGDGLSGLVGEFELVSAPPRAPAPATASNPALPRFWRVGRLAGESAQSSGAEARARVAVRPPVGTGEGGCWWVEAAEGGGALLTVAESGVVSMDLDDTLPQILQISSTNLADFFHQSR